MHGNGYANTHENLFHLDSASLTTLSSSSTSTTATATATATTSTALYAKAASTTVLHASFNSTGHDFAYQKPAYRSSIPPPPPPPSIEETAQSPFPTMPSQTYFDLATSQFELLINSIKFDNSDSSNGNGNGNGTGNGNGKKIKSLALYLPQENPNTGQLEFMPSLVTPPLPTSERIFIASDVQPTGYHVPPTLPPTLTQLPGFAHAATLLPAYPFTTNTNTGGTPAGVGNNGNDNGNGSSSSSSSGGKIGSVGVPEEVFCDLNLGKGISSTSSSSSASTLSLPLFSGPHTIGILLIWGSEPEALQHIPKTIAGSMWTADDKEQIKRVGESLALALCMDSDRFQSKIRSEEIRVALADNLHQVKNPVQALRTFSKLLQRNLATDGLSGKAHMNMNVAIGHLADDLVVQSERVVDLLLPMDSIINAMEVDGSGSGDGNGGVTSYQNLLAPMEHNEVDMNMNMNSNKEDGIVKSGDTGILLPASYRRRRTRSRSSSRSHSISNEEREQPHAKRGGHQRLLKTKQKGSEDIGLQMSFIPDVLQPVISASKVLAAERGVDIQFYGMDDELPGVMICPKLLQEAVSNVLDNAVKYVTLGNNGRHGVSNCKPTVRLRMSPNFESEDNLPPGVTILIDDNGPGILENEKDLVFQRGYRGELTNQLSNGSGIGLNISRAMIARMGGSLELLGSKSEDLGGAAMRFVLFRSPDLISSRSL